MKILNPLLLVFTAAALLAVFAIPGNSPLADEGMWTPVNLAKELPLEKLQKMGMAIEGEKPLFSAEAASVSDAIVQVVEFQPRGATFGFGSAAFVSDRGLILTNHHVAFDAIAANSTPEKNLVKDGFYAGSLKDEVPCPNTGVRICTTFEDVTEFVNASLPPNVDAMTRQRALQGAIQNLLKRAKDSGLKDAEVKVAFSGLRYHLVAYDTFRDVRLVYAPAQSIGEYGGDIDNWMWPRHTGDFTYLRAYVAPDGSRANYSPDNVPFNAPNFLKLDARGYAPEDFCFIMGFPGTTFRARTSYSVDFRERFLYPSQIQALDREVARLEAEGRKDPKKAIDNLSRIKSLNNTRKNFAGMVDGMGRLGLVEEKRAEEKAFRAWVDGDATRKEKWGDVFPRLDGHYAKLFNSDGLYQRLRQVMAGPFMSTFTTVTAIVQDARSPKPQVSGPARQRMLDSLIEAVEGMGAEAQRTELSAALKAMLELPEGQRPRALFFEETDDLAAWNAKALPTAMTRKEIEASAALMPGQLAKWNVPGLRFGFGLAEEMSRLNAERAAFNAEIGPLRARLTEAWAAWKGSLGYPDADSTLRLTYGRIRGYSPRDAIDMKYYTTAEGVMQKHTGVMPFAAPDRLGKLVEEKKWGRWADAKLGTLVCNFLSDTDITGGNSGSAIMNGKGHMIGLAFDGNYEAMTSDYRFMPEITRTINVDIRYVLWCTEMVDDMGRLLEEMTILR